MTRDTEAKDTPAPPNPSTTPSDDSRADQAQRPAASLPMARAVKGITGLKRSLPQRRPWGEAEINFVTLVGD